MKTKPKLMAGKAVSYFEHMERRADPKIVHYDVIEWPEPVEVKEHKSARDEWSFRKAWLNRLKRESK